MKRLFTLFFLVGITTVSKGQANLYHPFPDSNASWCAEWSAVYCFVNPPDVVYRSSYSLSGDTTINGSLYHILSQYELGYDQCTGGGGSQSYTHYIRQDIALKKVWLYDFTANTDTILYDFDLHIGDTLDASRVYWARNLGGTNYIVRSIDSIAIGGLYRKAYNYSPDFDSGCFSAIVEGMGSIHGLMYLPNNCFEYYAILHKFRQNNILLYGDSMPDYAACPSPGAGVADLGAKQQITITPNPVGQNGNIKILGMAYAEWEVQVFDLTGRRMKEFRFTGSSTELATTGLNAGMYLMRLTDKKSNMHFATMVIQ